MTLSNGAKGRVKRTAELMNKHKLNGNEIKASNTPVHLTVSSCFLWLFVYILRLSKQVIRD